MRAIRAVFHVAMIGDDDTVRRAAKTALTQVINATFKRAEKDFERLSSGESSTPTTSEAPATSSGCCSRCVRLRRKRDPWPSMLTSRTPRRWRWTFFDN